MEALRRTVTDIRGTNGDPNILRALQFVEGGMDGARSTVNSLIVILSNADRQDTNNIIDLTDSMSRDRR